MFGKKSDGKFGTLFTISDLVPTNFLLNILCDHCLHDLHLYIWKMFTYREVVNFQNGTFFDFLYTFIINDYRATTGARKMHIEIFRFIRSEQCIKSFGRAKSVDCLVLYSRKLFLITLHLPLIFKKWVGLLNPSYSVDCIRKFHGIALIITQFIAFYYQGIFKLYLPLFLIEINQNVIS